MRSTWLPLLLALTVVSAGCLGQVDPAAISADALEENGWSKSDEQSQSIANGMGQLVQRRYNPNDTPNRAGVTVVTANDVPLFDESRFLPRALESVERQAGVEFHKTGEQALELVNLDVTVTADVYDVRGAPADAKAVLFEAPCDPFVVVLAWGTTGEEGGFFGGGEANYYSEARDLARHVVC